jgi:hypothetical protein
MFEPTRQQGFMFAILEDVTAEGIAVMHIKHQR